MIVASPYLVLDKKPYRESALLLGGVSPDYGKLSLVLHGGQKLSEKSFPEADLFRELEVEFDDDGKGGELFTARNVSLTTAFDDIARETANFKTAGRMASFLLRNLGPGVPQPYTYDTLRSVFSQLAGQTPEGERWTLEQCSVVLKTAFLYENGLLPEAKSERQNEFMENLVAAGIDCSPLPECASGYWSRLNAWLNELIEFHQLKR